jgi:acyl dehydratase
MDAGMTFSRGIADRYFEDYVEGEVHRFGTIAVEADEMIAFAKRFDPQAMHTEPEAASRIDPAVARVIL